MNHNGLIAFFKWASLGVFYAAAFATAALHQTMLAPYLFQISGWALVIWIVMRALQELEP